MSNLGLLSLCDNDTEKAKSIIKNEGVVYCFRAGWAKYSQLKKISPTYFEDISITRYALAITDTSDIRLMHAKLLDEVNLSAQTLQVYKSIAAVYCASSLLIDTEDDVLIFELQKFINTAVALLLIDSDKKMFTTSLYQQLNTYFEDTEKSELLTKVDNCIISFSEQLPTSTKDYLQKVGLLDFTELKSIMGQGEDISIYIQEILELPITVANELNDDFEGGYDFHLDDDEDLAYLMSDLP